MKKMLSISVCISILLLIESCHKKKFTEVVEVPLPSKEDKIIIGLPEDVKAIEGAFDVIKLPYKFDDLAPNIDAMTMQIHYSNHYLNYINNLNKLVKGTENENLTIEEILKKLDLNDLELKRNAGGYYNHNLYWEIIGPKGGGNPKDSLASAINRDFGSYGLFKSQFIDSASKQIGSGWTWLVVDKTGKLQVTSSSNEDNPLMPKQTISGIPILAIDVWEHAYYLAYQNKRKKYIDAFFNVINWKKVSEKYNNAIKNE